MVIPFGTSLLNQKPNISSVFMLFMNKIVFFFVGNPESAGEPGKLGRMAGRGGQPSAGTGPYNGTKPGPYGGRGPYGGTKPANSCNNN